MNPALTAWRITKSDHAEHAFDGEGARLFGGRWNSPGTAVVYLAQSESLAALELLVHLDTSQLLRSYVSIPIALPMDSVEAIDLDRLPRRWQSFPAPAALRELGDHWAAEARSLALQVPSALVPRESNYLLNPRHPAMAKVRIGKPQPFDFDPRLK
jgi:RES domain-containing protein